MHCPLTVHALSTHCPRTVHEYCPRTVHEYYTQTTHVLHACTNVGAAIPSIGSVIDLIMVFAAFLVGRQTILVSFFSRERRNRKETNGWKNKSHRNWMLQIHLSRFVRKIVCPVSKNAIEE